MTSAIELIRQVEAAGGSLRVDDGSLVVAPKQAVAHLVDDLRQHKAEVMSLLCAPISKPTAPTDMEAWREPFGEWLNSRCAIHLRCHAGLNSLLAKYSEWEIDHVDVPVVPSREIFIQLLADHGFTMVESCGTVLVCGLALYQDIDAILGKPGNRIGGVSRKVRNAA
jgi:hypothetical protein